MKKTLATLVLAGAICSSFSQGTLTFNNSALTLISTNATSGGPATGTASPSLGSWYYALFSANTAVTTYAGNEDPAWTLRQTATNTAAASGGRLSGGQQATALPGGSTVNTIVRGWSANLGTTWAAVLNSLNNPGSISGGSYYLGQSAIGLNAIFNDPSAAPVNGVFGTTGGALIPGFVLNLNVVPEPSSMALAGLGAASLLLFRRRK